MKKLRKFKSLFVLNALKEKEIRNPGERRKFNTLIYFQIGLVLCLLLVYVLLESSFKKQTLEVSALMNTQQELQEEYVMPDITIYKEPVKLPKSKTVKPKLLTSIPEVVPNTSESESDLKDVITEPETNTNLKSSDIKLEDRPEDIDEVFNMLGVEVVPVYPGCEKYNSNEARKQCMSEKISRLIQREFDTSLGAEDGLSGIQKIQVQFKIDSKGQVTDVLARAPNVSLEREAKRIIGKIPDMTPGKQRDKNVSVIYTMPIVFKIQN
ncbi:energy transducer TonB [Formosa sp. S-31]|uniref:energy transducer TonB n=1 Tax=Formosa sp. S-31 TaxID=2790949 RepID=UPI003EB9F021